MTNWQAIFSFDGVIMAKPSIYILKSVSVTTENITKNVTILNYINLCNFLIALHLNIQISILKQCYHLKHNTILELHCMFFNRSPSNILKHKLRFNTDIS